MATIELDFTEADEVVNEVANAGRAAETQTAWLDAFYEVLTGTTANPNKSQESTHNIHIIHYVMTSFTLDPLHSEISWLRGPFFELLRFFCDGADLFALQRQSSCTLTRSREATL